LFFTTIALNWCTGRNYFSRNKRQREGTFCWNYRCIYNTTAQLFNDVGLFHYIFSCSQDISFWMLSDCIKLRVNIFSR